MPADTVVVQPLNTSAEEAEIFSIQIEDRYGPHSLSVRLLQELGSPTPYLTTGKLRDLWIEYSQHDVLFSDETQGKVRPFVEVLLAPGSLWLEIFSLDQQKPVGIMSISDIIVGFDAKGHFAFWDSIAKDREPIVHETMKWVFQRYSLHRISAHVPIYQSGTIRFIKRLGFEKEGEMREAVIRKGRWFPLVMFGITIEEFKEVYNG